MNCPHTISLDIADAEDRSDIGDELLVLARLDKLRRHVRLQTAIINDHQALLRSGSVFPGNLHHSGSLLRKRIIERRKTLAQIADLIDAA